MEAIPVKEFFKYTPQELQDGYRISNPVLFEDNVILHLSWKEMVVNRYLFELLVDYPIVPVISKYTISNHYTNGIFATKSINKCFEIMLKDIVKYHFTKIEDRFQISEVYRKMMVIVNTIYNDLVYSNLEYAHSSNVLDYLDIQMQPELLDALKKVEEKKDIESINNSYEVLDKVIKTNPALSSNSVGRSYISGMINPNQVKQVLASRGYVTEIDGKIFKEPIASSFTLGMTNMYDMAIESRSGAKALFLSNVAVQDSEYLARELQLVGMVVERMEHTDCGNKDYVDWYVRKPGETNKSDISNLVGKRYLNLNTGKEEIITSSHTFLEGTTIKLRSAYKCKLKDKHKICSTCYGELAYGIHKHTAFGHINISTITQKITQNILSTKHLTTSASTDVIRINDIAKKFFVVKDKNGYAFKSGILGKANSKISIIINQNEAFGIKDITADNIYKLDPARVSRIESITLMVESKKNVEYFPINIKDGHKYGSFTVKMLEYILSNGFTLDREDRYIIDLSNFKSVVPIISLPQIEYNFLDLATEIKNILKSMNKIGNERFAETPESITQKLFDLLNSKLDINIALIEVMVYAFTINSYKDGNYDLGRNNQQELADIRHIMPNRSLGGAFAWEYVANTIMDPHSFINKNRTDHPLDVLLKPQEVMKKYDKKRITRG